MRTDTRDRGPSRREFLKGDGGGWCRASRGLGSRRAGGWAAPRAPRRLRGQSAGARLCARRRAGLECRLRPHIPSNLPAFAATNDSVRSALLEVGQQGGVLDAQDDLTAGPKALIVDPTVNGDPTVTNPYGTNPDNPTMTAGSTFVGQFTDHDITFDQTSQLGVPQNPSISPNTRTPALDLDSVFGGGPALRPDLYVNNPDGTVGPKLKIGSVIGPAPDYARHEDVPRVANGDGSYSALLGDPRDDENVMIAGLHCAHILFYNRVLEDLSEFDVSHFPAARAGDRSNPYVAFLIARQVTLWHYQWLLVNEHLPQIAGQAIVNDVLQNGNRFYKPPPGDAFMPIEFGAACLPVRAQHGPPLLPGELHQRHRRWHKPDRGPVLWAGVRPEPAGQRTDHK